MNMPITERTRLQSMYDGHPYTEIHEGYSTLCLVLLSYDGLHCTLRIA